jgi:hypothetical protein
MALAAGLTQVLDDRRYTEIIMTRATVSVGEDIGFLPGTEEEKMGPWMGALDDNLEFLAKGDGGNAGEWGRAATNELIKSRIKIKSMNFMRGRTFMNKYVIIDEAQNLTPKQMKTLITRAGPGTTRLRMTFAAADGTFDSSACRTLPDDRHTIALPVPVLLDIPAAAVPVGNNTAYNSNQGVVSTCSVWDPAARSYWCEAPPHLSAPCKQDYRHLTSHDPRVSAFRSNRCLCVSVAFVRTSASAARLQKPPARDACAMCFSSRPPLLAPRPRRPSARASATPQPTSASPRRRTRPQRLWRRASCRSRADHREAHRPV